MPNQLSNLIFLRRCSMRPWVLPSVGYVTLVKSMNLICKSGVTGMFRECGEDSRDDAHGRHKTALGTQLALSEYLLSLSFFTWLPGHKSLFPPHSLTPFPYLIPTSLLIQILFFSLQVTQMSLLQRGFYWLAPLPTTPNVELLNPLWHSLSALSVLPLEPLFCGTCSAVSAFAGDILPCHSMNIFSFISRNLAVSDWPSAHWSGQYLRCLSSRGATSQSFLWDSPLSPAIIWCSVTPWPCCLLLPLLMGLRMSNSPKLGWAEYSVLWIGMGGDFAISLASSALSPLLWVELCPPTPDQIMWSYLEIKSVQMTKLRWGH